MIIGNGLLAKAFLNKANDDEVLIFASGVSNSGATDEAVYIRELELLKHYLNNRQKFIYFSTISIYDSSLTHTRYIQHKLQIERLIAATAEQFLIFRLPIVVGRSSNPNTLMNYLYNKIHQREKVLLHKNACRYIMDVDDVSFYLSHIIESGAFMNTILNVHMNNQTSIVDIVNQFEELLGIMVHKEIVDKGSCYDVDAGEFLSFAQIPSIDKRAYLNKVITKYYLS